MDKERLERLETELVALEDARFDMKKPPTRWLPVAIIGMGFFLSEFDISILGVNITILGFAVIVVGLLVLAAVVIIQNKYNSRLITIDRLIRQKEAEIRIFKKENM